LKNEGHILPLNPQTVHSIAVIGPNADQVEFGDYSASKSNDDGTTVRTAMEAAGSAFSIRYAKGCDLVKPDKSGFDEAISAVRQSDVAIVVIGDTSMVLGGRGNSPLDGLATVGEGFDRSELGPPGIQGDLVRAVIETGKPTIVVMVNGRPYSVPWIKAHANAIMLAFYPGQQGGEAIADILFGKTNPSGHLPVSVAQDAGHIPTVYDYKPSSRGYYHEPGSPDRPGRDYVFSSPDALWPFGFGLSYTTFEVSHLQILTPIVKATAVVRVSVDVRNSGSSPGKEVVQIYSHQETSSTTTPVRRLRRFAKILLQPSETRTLKFEIPASEFAIWNREMQQVVEHGAYTLFAGTDAEDSRLHASFTIR